MALLLGGLILGVTGGVAYGLIAFAVVWLYKCTGVVNFAQGAMATLSAFLIWNFMTNLGMPVWVSIALALVAGLITGLLLYLVVMRLNDNASAENLLMRTLAAYLLIAALVNWTWGAGQPFKFPSIFPEGAAYQLGGVTITWLAVITLVVGAVCGLAAAAFFRFTRVGLLFLALADNRDASRAIGIPIRRLSAIAWGVAGLIGVIVGLLVAPSSALTTTLTDPYLLFAFAAAILGGLDSLGGAFVGGLIVGVINSLGTIYVGKDTATLLVFLVFLLTLLLRPQGLFGKPDVQRV